jgi:pyridoxamine 5'-phosphate oxidase
VIPDQFADPFALFAHYFARAKATEPQDPTAMSLATASADGRPAVRMVLLKGTDARGFLFFTNYQSYKAGHLRENPYAALCLHWPVMQVQVRGEGPIERLTAAESDAYFQSRPRGSQLAAWSSHQSAPLESRDLLLARYRELEERFAGQPIPRPEFWGGFRIVTERLEFWAGEPFRMHDRLLYVRQPAAAATTTPGSDASPLWTKTRLNP